MSAGCGFLKYRTVLSQLEFGNHDWSPKIIMLNETFSMIFGDLTSWFWWSPKITKNVSFNMMTFHGIWWFLVTFDDYWWFFMMKSGDLSWYIMIDHDKSPSIWERVQTILLVCYLWNETWFILQYSLYKTWSNCLSALLFINFQSLGLGKLSLLHNIFTPNGCDMKGVIVLTSPVCVSVTTLMANRHTDVDLVKRWNGRI